MEKKTNSKIMQVSKVFKSVKEWGAERETLLGDFCVGWWEPEEEWFWPIKPFSKLKTTFCKYWTLIKIKISLACVYKEYEVKVKMVQEQWLQLKMKFLLGYSMKIVI